MYDYHFHIARIPSHSTFSDSEQRVSLLLNVAILLDTTLYTPLIIYAWITSFIYRTSYIIYLLHAMRYHIADGVSVRAV